jgi:hypothetical protein
MPVIRIHLQREELAAITRRAVELGITEEDLVYGALSCSMSRIKEPFYRAGIVQAVSGRSRDLPLWSDSAPSIAAYEGMPGEESEPGPKGGPLQKFHS